MKKQNQEASLDYYIPRFRELNPSEAAERTNLAFDHESSRFILNALGHVLYAEWPEFKLIPADSESCPEPLYSFPAQVLTMRILLTGVYAPSGGSFKAYRELPWGELYDKNFSGRCIKRFAYGFGFKLDKFVKAAEKLGGEKLTLGDAAFDFPFFGGITSRFILWVPDDEFPPSAQILFTDNSVVMYNAEDLAVVGDVIITSLRYVEKLI